MQKRLKHIEKEKILDLYNANLNCTQIALKYGVSCQAIYQFLKRKGVALKTQSELQRKYSLDETVFETIGNEKKAYFLGLLYADGYIYKKKNTISLSLQDKDLDIVSSFQTFLNSNRPLLTICYPNPSWRPQYRLVVQSPRIIKDLEKLGCTQNKTFTLKFPSLHFELNPHFIRGYFDGDGSVWVLNRKSCKSNLYANLMGNKEFLEDLIKIVPIDCKAHIRKQRSIYSLDFSCKNAIRFLEWLYSNASIYGSRKHNNYNASLNILRLGMESLASA